MDFKWIAKGLVESIFLVASILPGHGRAHAHGVRSGICAFADDSIEDGFETRTGNSRPRYSAPELLPTEMARELDTPRS